MSVNIGEENVLLGLKASEKLKTGKASRVFE